MNLPLSCLRPAERCNEAKCPIACSKALASIAKLWAVDSLGVRDVIVDQKNIRLYALRDMLQCFLASRDDPGYNSGRPQQAGDGVFTGQLRGTGEDRTVALCKDGAIRISRNRGVRQ